MNFSIIIPVYNVGNYLRECIESVIKQSRVSYEVILVDDGSKDESTQICDEYTQRYDFISVIHKENGGLSDARNKGIDIAKGEYILFVDGDDYIGGDSLRAIADVIEKEKHPDVVCLELVKFFENSSKTIAMEDGIDKKISELKNDKLYEYLADLPKYPASACTKAIRRQLFFDYDLYFVKGLLSEDLEWSIRLFLAAKTICYCPYKYYYYRQARVNSISNTSSEKKVMDILSTFQKWTNYVSNLTNQAEKKMICSYMEYIFRFLLLGYENISKENCKMFKKAVKAGSWILGTRKDMISTCIQITYKIFGIKITGILLKRYLILRGY